MSGGFIFGIAEQANGYKDMSCCIFSLPIEPCN